MADVDVDQLGGPIDIAFAVGIPEVDAFAMHHADGLPFLLGCPAGQGIGFVGCDHLRVVHGGLLKDMSNECMEFPGVGPGHQRTRLLYLRSRGLYDENGRMPNLPKVRGWIYGGGLLL